MPKLEMPPGSCQPTRTRHALTVLRSRPLRRSGGGQDRVRLPDGVLRTLECLVMDPPQLAAELAAEEAAEAAPAAKTTAAGMHAALDLACSQFAYALLAIC